MIKRVEEQRVVNCTVERQKKLETIYRRQKGQLIHFLSDLNFGKCNEI